ncbi:MAG: hypothetical protein AB1546_15860 [bacterium]
MLQRLAYRFSDADNRLRGWNRLSVIVERIKKPQPMDEHRFERRNRNRITRNMSEILESSA